MKNKCTNSIAVLDDYSDCGCIDIRAHCQLENGHKGMHQYTDEGNARIAMYRKLYYTKYTISWE